MSVFVRKVDTCQELIYLDIGGTPFKMLRTTVENFPRSLIARVLNEHPEFGQKNKPVYIDRDPKMFPWILEIYREGDDANTVPRESGLNLTRELAFYGLPTGQELEIVPYCVHMSFLADKPSTRLMRAILHQIHHHSLQERFPWCAYIYFIFPASWMPFQRKILIVPNIVRLNTSDPDVLNYISAEHRSFAQELLSVTVVDMQPETELVTLSSHDKKMKYSLQLPTDELIDLLSKEAPSFGLNVEARQIVSSPADLTFASLPYLHFYPSG